MKTGGGHCGARGPEAMGGGCCDGVGQPLQPSGINVVTMKDDDLFSGI